MTKFPNYKVKRGEKTIYDVTIKHLMIMKAPLKCKYDPWTKVCSSDDWTISSLDFIVGRKGITGYFKLTIFDRIDFIQKYLDE